MCWLEIGITGRFAASEGANCGHRLLDLAARFQSHRESFDPAERRAPRRRNSNDRREGEDRWPADGGHVYTRAAPSACCAGAKLAVRPERRRRGCDVGEVPAETRIIELDERALLDAISTSRETRGRTWIRPKAVASFAKFGPGGCRRNNDAFPRSRSCTATRPGSGNSRDRRNIPNGTRAEAAFLVPAMTVYRINGPQLCCANCNLGGPAAELRKRPARKKFYLPKDLLSMLPSGTPANHERRSPLNGTCHSQVDRYQVRKSPCRVE